MQKQTTKNSLFLTNNSRTHVRTQTGMPDLREEAFYVIDWKNTYKHDDALHIKKQEEGYRIKTAIPDVGAPSTIYYENLPEKLSMWPYKKPLANDFSMNHGTLRAAIILSYWTDGKSIDDAVLSRGIIRPQGRNKKDLPPRIHEQLLQATNTHNIRYAITKTMLMLNRLAGDWFEQNNIPAPYHNHQKNKRYYALDSHGHEGLNIPRYANISHPLQSDVHRVTVKQLHDALTNDKIANEKEIQAFCKHYNKRIQNAA